MKAQRPALQRLINRCAAATAAAHAATNALDDYCVERYGFAPCDRDVDSILDRVYSLAGVGAPISAAEFDKLMMEAAQP